jgi:hypothetical protein
MVFVLERTQNEAQPLKPVAHASAKKLDIEPGEMHCIVFRPALLEKFRRR